MKEEIRQIARGLKEFLKNTDEDEIILKAALKPKKAAFTSLRKNNKENLTAAETITGNDLPEQKAAEENNLQASITARTQEQTVLQSAKPVTEKQIFYQTAIKEHPMPKKQKSEILPQQQAFDKAEEISHIAQLISSCQKCELGKTRIKAVPGEGNINAEIMFVGEGPGFDEDRQGRPFVGRAGQLLDKIITAMGFTRQEVFIANIVKCHPMTDPSNPDKHGNDRAPNSDEIAVCRKYIEQQIKVISPKYVVALGKIAAQTLISEDIPTASMRGKIYDLKLSCTELDKPVKIMATYHPAALLRNPGWKKEAWAHLKGLLAAMGRKPAAG